MSFRDPTHTRFSKHMTYGHCFCSHPRRHARLKVYPQLPAQTSRETPLKTPSLNSQTSHERRGNRPTTTETTPRAPSKRNVQEREPRNKTPTEQQAQRPGTRSQEQNAQE